ncbi:MAG: AMP-binding protein [Gammaproteobacteria bacterium]|nr:AMP-binding protein [Gammaproteobacteria bacterium]
MSETVILGNTFANVAELLHEAARGAPDAPAVTFNGATRTWAEVESRSRAAATLLARLGVGKGDRVALLGLNSDVCFESYFSPALIGAMFVPLNYRLAARELKECLEDCEPVVLLAEAEFVATAKAMQEQCPHIRHVIAFGGADPEPGVLDYESSLAEIIATGSSKDSYAESSPGGSDDAILLFYTGGTTGKSKGVMLSNRNMLSNTACAVEEYRMERGWNFIILGPLFHLASGARIFNCAALYAHAVVLSRFDAGIVLGSIDRYTVDSATFVPTMVQMVLDHPEYADYDLSSLKIVTCGAAPLSLALQRRLLRALPGVRQFQTYGMTEASPILTILDSVYHVTEGPLSAKLGSVGKPPGHVEIRVVDANDNDLPPYAVGEVLARGPNIMVGYWRQPELTAEAMRGGWYHTGDAGYLDEEGFLFLEGRVKDMIVSGGENVYPIEVENVLAEHPAVKECAVIGIPHEKWGEAVHAVVILESGTSAREDELIGWCKKNLAGYKCPVSVSFRSQPMPLSSVNKVLKTELRKPWWEGRQSQLV